MAQPLGFEKYWIPKPCKVKFSSQHNQFIDGGYSEHTISRGISIDTEEEEEEEEENSHQTMEIGKTL